MNRLKLVISLMVFLSIALSGQHRGSIIQPEIFLPGTVSTKDNLEFGGTLSPDGKAFYFTRRGRDHRHNTIMVSVKTNEQWRSPEVVSISDPYPKMNPRFFPDGSRMVYTAWRPPEKGKSPFSQWMVKIKEGKWGKPEFYKPWFSMSVSKVGTIFFHSPEGIGWIKKLDGKYGKPEILGKEVNAEKSFTQHSYVSPDGSYMVFDSNRPGGYGESDLYAVFRDQKGQWTRVVNLGDKINNEKPNFCPSISPDGRFLFYTTGEDIYRVSTKVIKKLKSPSTASVAERTYPRQSLPGMKPERFDPGIFPEGKGVLNPIFSPDGATFYFTVELIPGRSYRVYKSKWENGRWSKPVTDPVLEKMNGGEPSFTPDGNYILFNSKLDKNGKNQGHTDIWRVKRDAGKSMDPEKLGFGINSEFNDAFPVLSSDGTLYFHSNREGGEGVFDIYTSRSQGRGFVNPVNLGNNVNSKFPEFHPCISPDESFLIFSSLNRPNGIGHIDLYVSFRGQDGEWTKAVNLGREINSEMADYMPFVSHDGKYLFFTSTRQIEGVDSGVSPFGKPSIYWVNAEVIEKLRPVVETKASMTANPDTEFLSKLERTLNQKLGLVTGFGWSTVGVAMTGGRVSGIGLFNKKLKQWPSGIWKLSKLKYLYLGNNELGSIPEDITQLKELEEIWLNYNGLQSLPECLFDLRNLKKLSVYSNNIKSLQKSLGNLVNLTELHLSKNKIETLPDSIGKLINLKVLDISDNPINHFPGSLDRLRNLEVLAIKGNIVRKKLNFLSGFSKLKRLKIDKSQVPFIPDSVLNNSGIKIIIK